ncbi:MAG: DUF4430 domain-containing protein [Clostridia bacterium]|nr:DUF4430 domain-containing protein [Clostridia bacterium]
MNKIKIVSLILAVLMLLPLVASCGTKTYTAENVTIVFRKPVIDEIKTEEEGETVYKTDAEGNIVYEDCCRYDIPVVEATTELREQVTDENGRAVPGEFEPILAPTVLAAVETTMKHFEEPYDLSKDGTYVASAFGLTEAERLDAEKGYYDYWHCTINGKESESGRQSVTQIYSEDEIVFTWTSGFKDRLDVTDEVTEDPADVATGEIDLGDEFESDTAEEIE